MQLKEHILQLLQDHECVIVPEFGGFILNPESSKYDQLQHKFYPPSKKVSFNRNLIKNDGLLAQSVSTEAGTSYNDALQLITQEKDRWREQLQKEGTLQLSGLGFFRQSKSGVLSFEPDEQTAFGFDSFGLEPFHALPIEKEKAPTVENTAESNPSAAKTVSGLPKIKWGYVAASLIAVPVLGYAAWLASSGSLFQGNHQFHYSDLNPFSEKICEVYKPNSSNFTFRAIHEESPFALPELKDFTSPTAEIKFLEDEEGALIVRLADENHSAPAQKRPVKNTEITGRYHVIAGCFSVKENAEQLSKELQQKGYNSARILDKEGRLYRVTAGTFERKLDARVALRDFKTLENASAWITKK